jgi:putative ABC transport system substrate-binding protein
MRRIGVLMNVTADDPEAPVRLAAFLQGMQQLGWMGNVRIYTRSGADDAERSRRQAAELVALAPDVILCSGSAVGQLLQGTRTVPIVFVLVVDPVGSGFAASLARPSGNATGFPPFEYGISGKSRAHRMAA